MELIDEYISLLSYCISAAIIVTEALFLLIYLFSKDGLSKYVALRMGLSGYLLKYALRMNLQDISPIRLALSLMGVLGLNSSFSIYFLQISNSYYFDVAVVFSGLVINMISLIVCLFMLAGMRLRAISERGKADLLKVELERDRVELQKEKVRLVEAKARTDAERVRYMREMEELNKAKNER